MSILRITLGSLRFLGQPAKAAAGATPGDPVTSARITCTPAVDGAAVMAAGVHTVTPEVITASAITDTTPWTYDLVDPTGATPTGWGWTITIAPAGGGEPLVASLTAATIAALPATDGVRTARLEDWIQTGTPGSQPGVTITTLKVAAGTSPGQALTLDGTGAVVVGVDVTEGMAAAEKTAQAAAQTATDKASAASDSAMAAFGSAADSAQSAADALNAKNTVAALSLTASATQVAAGGAPTASVTGSMPNLALALGIPAGQPSTYELRGSGSPYNVVTPPGPGYYYTDSVGTCGAWRWMSTGTSKTSWIPVMGDTGWRNITSKIINGWTVNSLYVRRCNNNVHLAIYQLTGSASTATTFVSLPAGFISNSPNTSFPVKIGGSVTFIAGTSSGNLTCSNTTWTIQIGNDAFTEVIWAASAQTGWPTALPGTAV